MATLIQYKNNVAGVRIAIDTNPFRIGRSEENDLCINDELSSREHALIEAVRSETDAQRIDHILRDLDSTNGTYVNHNPVTSHLLVEGDMIRIGQTFFRYSTSQSGDDPGDTRIMKKSIIPGIYYTTDKNK